MYTIDTFHERGDTRRKALEVLSGGLLSAAVVAGAEPSGVRLVISEEVLRGVNRNDAAAAIGVWADEVSKAIGIRIEGRRVLRGSAEVQAGLEAGTVEVVCVTLLEYRRMAAHLDVAKVLSTSGGEVWMMVRQDSGVTTLSELQGRRLVIHDNPYSQVADAWLTVAFAKEGLGKPEAVLGQVTRQTRAAQAVLPVFFGQADACMTERRTVETMSELNPQLAKRLKLLVATPRLLAAFLCCRKGNPPRWKEPLLAKLVSARESTSARQALALFSALNFSMMDGEILRPSLAILEAAERLGQGKRLGN
ncbi:MAG: PhnD/SsuA/transferrin family substrate-binding protein [Bryobacterales bacterium]|nr:PhnD/SsuA/transferrin family substrate-binding protein [Bryobacterales bacterium]